MPYSQEHYDEAYRMREHGTDDESIRMVLVSKKLSSSDIDELFVALDAALPPKKSKSFGGFGGDETARDIAHRDFNMMMTALMVIGAVMAGIGVMTHTNILWVLGAGTAFFGLWSLSRAARDDRRAERKRNRDERHFKE